MDKKRQKILIVDDMPSNILVLSEILQEDYEINFATNGSDCLELTKAEKPDLILLDIMMPGVDGYEVCRILKAAPETKNIPIIFVTAMGNVADEAKGLELGAIDYIVKPISPPIVKARVKNHLELKKYRDLLEELSLRDGLTGIANRRYFNEVIETECKRASRTDSPLSLLMIDIDLFKKFNDTYGHQAGDECLKKVAGTIKATVKRSGDLVARYGGEEFAVVLPATDVDNAYVIAKLIKKNLESLKIPHQSSDISDFVTVSIGVAGIYPQKDILASSTLIKKADQALYIAKSKGRNRVIKCS